MEDKNKGGRPLKYKTEEELRAAINEYFNPDIGDGTQTKEGVKHKPFDKPTLTGLALHLGFESRQSLYDYEKDGRFSYTIKEARLRIESMYEAKLYEPGCTGAIFALKNFGWTDKQEVQHSGDPESPVIFKLDERFGTNSD